MQVQLIGFHPDQVAGWPGQQPLADLGVTVLSELFDVPLQRGARAGRGSVIPQRLDERRHGDDLVRVQQERSQHRALLAWKVDVSVVDLKRTKNPEFHQFPSGTDSRYLPQMVYTIQPRVMHWELL